MRKSRLLQIEPKHPSGRMVQMAISDRRIKRKWRQRYGYSYTAETYETAMYYTAREEDGILVIAGHTRKDMADGNLRPRFVTYIDSEEKKWISQAGGKWTEAYMENLQHWAKCDDNEQGFHCPETADLEDLAVVNAALGTEEKTIEKAVFQWQSGVRTESNKTKARKKEDYWNGQMKRIPPLPDDFAEWADMEGTAKENFLFYRKRGKDTEVYCTRCGQAYFTGMKMRHYSEKERVHSALEYFFCERCGTRMPSKQWERQKHVTRREVVLLAQRVGEQIAFRNFTVLKKFELKSTVFGNVWEKKVSLIENLRVIANAQTFESEESYEQRVHQATGKYLWAEVKSSGYYGMAYSRRPLSIGHGVPYTRNLEEVLTGSGCRPAIAKMFVKGNSCYMQGSLARAVQHGYIEYLVRAGLNSITKEIVDMRWEPADPKATNLKDLLGIDGQQLYLLKKLDGNSCMVEAMWYVKEHGEKISEETLEYISRKTISIDYLEMERTGMTLQRMINYIRKQAEAANRTFSQMKSIYRDYLDMAEERGMDPTDEIVCHTPRLIEMHDRYAEEKNRAKNEKEAARVNKQFRTIEKDYQNNSEHFAYQKAGLVIMVPKKASEIQEEGRKQHHCVGASDNYIRKMAERESFILFLRKAEALESPYYTLEVKYDGEIIQSYGAYDRKPDYNKVKPVLESFTRKIRKRIKTAAKAQADVLASAG